MLTDKMVIGKEPVRLYQETPEKGRTLEGEALILTIHQGDRSGVEADVRLVNDSEGPILRRWIFASDQEV